MFTISVCMIVKNESLVLKRILECVKQFADEIIIVDTGSSDNTKEIALNYSDKVFDFEWVNDFSKARNYAFSKASCDYQMWLDADDIITQENIQKIITLKNTEVDINQCADVFMCKYLIGFDSQNVPTFVFDRERILKRSCNFKWQGFVHEVIVPTGKIESTDIEIEHRKPCYTNPKRNLKLYQNALKNGIQLSERELYYYSRELFYNGQFSKAITNLKKFIKLKNTYPPDNLGAHIMLCDCFLTQNKVYLAESIMLEALKKHVATAEVCCKLASINVLKSNNQQAIFWYQSALCCPTQKMGFVRKDYCDIIPLLELCKLYWTEKDYQKSKEYHEKAKALRPTHKAVLYNQQFFD